MRLTRLSDEFINHLAKIAAGGISSDTFENLLRLIETEIRGHYFTRSSESNLLRIIEVRYDKIFFLNECVKYPHYVELLVSISSNSNYLSDILVLNPEFFYWVVNPSVLKSSLNKNSFPSELNKSLNSYKSFEVKVHALSTIKRKEFLRIGLKDIYQNYNLEDITKELSILASAISAELFSLCYKEILNKYKIEKISGRYCIISLGKLGGEELNYSSDIDLIIFYNKDYTLKDGKHYSEVLAEALQLFLKKASEGGVGFLYRIDFRLRPEGKHSPICRSMNDYLNYYESRGDDWERQMLIKADFLCGSKSLYQKFINYLQPFIFPPTHTLSPLHQVKKLKDIIEKNLTDNTDIKLIPGGIRDIEFSIQALQLINGGRDKSLRTGNSLTSIKRLKEADFLNEKETNAFLSAYIFYRKIEHYLQLMNNKQTHIIPEEGEILEKLSCYLGYNTEEKFRQKVGQERKIVREIFNSIINVTEEPIDLLRHPINFVNEKKAVNDLSYLRDGRGLISEKQFDKKTVESFKKIEQELLTYLHHSNNPDKVLANFVRVIRSADFPSIWYKEFLDKKFFNSFLKVCEYSQKAVDLFAEDKVLREYFLNREIFNCPAIKELMSFAVKRLLFMFAVQITLKIIKPLSVSQTLSEVLRGKIQLISENFSKGKEWGNKYFVAVLGSTGTSAMTFASDIDMVFAIQNLTDYPQAPVDFQELLRQIQVELKPFPVDCRLRPEGESSQLVWDIKNYIDYYDKRARMWEFQSFIKIHFVAGNNQIFSRLKNSVIERMGSLNKKVIKNDIMEMRKKTLPTLTDGLEILDLKKSAGALADIDYIIHYLILCKTESIKTYIGMPVERILKLIVKEKPSLKNLKELRENYKFLKQVELYKQSVFNSNSSKLSMQKEELILITELMGFKNVNDFIKKFNDTISSNRKFYKNIITN